MLQPIHFSTVRLKGRKSTVRRKGVSLHSLSLWVLNTQDFLEKGFVLHSLSLWLLNFLVLSRSWTYLELTIIGGIWVWQTLLVKCCILFSRMETMYVVFYVNSSLRLQNKISIRQRKNCTPINLIIYLKRSLPTGPETLNQNRVSQFSVRPLGLKYPNNLPVVMKRQITH